MSGQRYNGVVQTGNREYPIERANVFARLPPDWLGKVSPSSLWWEVEIWCQNQKQFCDFPNNPAVELRFRRQDYGTVRDIDAATYTTDETLSGVVRVEYSLIDTGVLAFEWRDDHTLKIEGKVETRVAIYNFQGIGNFNGIRVQDTGNMDIAPAAEILKRAIALDYLDLSGIRKSRQLPDGREYTEILFPPTW